MTDAELIKTLQEDRAAEILLSLYQSLKKGTVSCEVIEAWSSEECADLNTIQFTFLGQLSTHGRPPWIKS